MFTRLSFMSVVLALIGLTAGCLGPRRDDYRSSQPLTITDPSPETDQVWEAVQETLRRHRFQLDRVDRRARSITTMPLTSQHIFEFWRHDVDTGPDLWESTLNPIRRWVEVTVARADDKTWMELAVVVHKERLSSPDRQFNNTGAAYQYFSDSLPSTEGIIRVTAEDDMWLDQGRDPAMEDYLLRAIFERVGRDGSTREPG